MSEKPAQIHLYLNLRSADLSPNQISEQPNVGFDCCHRKGEPRGKNHMNEAWWEQHQRFWEESWWTIYAEAETTYATAYETLPKTLNQLLTRIEPSQQTFARLASGGYGELAIVLYCEGYPGIGFDAELMSRIARLGVYVDFDLYVDVECKRPHADGE